MKRIFSSPIAALTAGLCLRLLFVLKFPANSGDTVLYEQIATNWLQHHVYGMNVQDQIVPVDLRMPGYPAFLALVYAISGAINGHVGEAARLWVMIAQVVMDLLTCLVVAGSDRQRSRAPTTSIHCRDVACCVVSVHSELCCCAADRGLGHVFHDGGVVAALRGGYSGAEPRVAALGTALDTGQRLLVPRGLGWAVDRVMHAIPPRSATAFGSSVAGAGCNSNSTARKFALAKDCSADGGILRP